MRQTTDCGRLLRVLQRPTVNCCRDWSSPSESGSDEIEEHEFTFRDRRDVRRPTDWGEAGQAIALIDDQLLQGLEFP